VPELRFFAQQYYQRTARMFPKLVAAIYSRCPDDPELEHMLLENVVSESGFADPTKEHKQLFFQFGRALGLSREDIERAKPVPEPTSGGSSRKASRCTGSCSMASSAGQRPLPAERILHAGE